ncbi:MAG: 2-dehydropantoate 2-reductase [Candidatus Thermoplasmatota archaeon]
MQDEYRFGVVGAGPIGSIMGAHLARVGHHVVLVDILKEHLDEIKRRGLRITGVREFTARFSPDSLCYSIEELKGKEVDILFIAVKASLLGKLVPMIEEAVGLDTTLISLQNGMDTEEFIAETFGRERVLRIVVNYAGNLVANGTVRMSFFHAPNYIGTISPAGAEKAKTLAEMITAAGLETAFTPEIKRYEWEKTILNAALSPVCALTRKTMKQMMSHPLTRALVEQILRESIAVANASGMKFDEEFLAFCMDYLDKAGHHKTSMHVDVERGTSTEIDFLNGKLVEYGRMHSVPTPYNSTIVSLIKGVEIPEHVE